MLPVSNATPLIYLAKVGRLDLLRKVFGGVLIPEEVRKEVVDEGKRLGKADALMIEQAVREGWIEVRSAGATDSRMDLGAGERAVLSLARQEAVNVVLMDEPPARAMARLLGLEPRGTMYVLPEGLKRGELDLDGFLETLESMVEQGYRLREEVYLEAVRRARRLAEDARRGPSR